MCSCQLDIVMSLSESSWARAGVELATKLPARNKAIKNHLAVFISSPPFVGSIFFLGQPPCQSFDVKNLLIRLSVTVSAVAAARHFLCACPVFIQKRDAPRC